MMAKGIALFTVMFMLVGCGAHVNISASAPKGKDLDITVKTTESNWRRDPLGPAEIGPSGVDPYVDFMTGNLIIN